MIFLLAQLLDQAAERSPDDEAVRCAGQSLTYQELAGKADRLARVLIEEGVRPGDRVGLYLEKSLESLVAIYGAMKARAAYVPIDPLVPASRLAFIVEDCGIRHLITGPAKAGQVRRLTAASKRLECLIGLGLDEGPALRSIPWREVWQAPAAVSLRRQGTELDLAYILYTSGSTGKPKGVMHSHRSALSFVHWAVAEFAVGAGDRLSNHAPFHFDLSVFDVFAAAAAGASMVVVPEDVAKFPVSLAELISDEKLTVWYSVPYALIQLAHKGGLASRDLGALRAVLFAGEPFPPKHLRRLMELLPRASFFNLYGPTETNVCTVYPLPPGAAWNDEPVPIGRPCANTELVVVGTDGEEAPAGEPGELLVRGPSTMQGYWGRPELTAEAFSNRSLEPPREERFYRTGDLVRSDAEGNYHFLGRRDRQIKLRGFRIELDEIEGALLAHEDVEQAAVYLAAGDDGSASIEAAVVCAPGSTAGSESLTAHLSKLLPPYAVPSRILTAEQFPRTSTGKLDRRRLEAQKVAVGGRRESQP